MDRRPGAGEAASIVFKLTSNSLREGGRARHPHEAYLNVNAERFIFFGSRHITVVTGDGREFPALLSGSGGRNSSGTPKNLRSRPATALGEWLAACRAEAGDEVHATHLPDGRFLFQLVRLRATLAEAPPARPAA
jgi:hypothetical protein